MLKNLDVVISGVSTALNGEFHFILHYDISSQREAFVELFTVMSKTLIIMRDAAIQLCEILMDRIWSFIRLFALIKENPVY